MVKFHLQFQFTQRMLVCVHCRQVTNTHFTMFQRYKKIKRLLQVGWVGSVLPVWCLLIPNLFIKPSPLYLISVAFFSKFITVFPLLLAFLGYFFPQLSGTINK